MLVSHKKFCITSFALT